VAEEVTQIDVTRLAGTELRETLDWTRAQLTAVLIEAFEEQEAAEAEAAPSGSLEVIDMDGTAFSLHWQRGVRR
jgi:antitoxin component HigA of HigAB toxin-antitoxin module